MPLTSLLRKWRALPRPERRLRLEALLWLGLVGVLIPLLPLRRIARLLGLNPAPPPSPTPSPADAEPVAAQTEMAAQISRAVQGAAAKTPWQSACLAQALTGAAMLRRRRLQGMLYLGVAREATLPKGVAAHAWLRCGSAVVTGGAYARYAVVGKYTW